MPEQQTVGNVEGVGAASLNYFRRPAAIVTLAEALTLAGVPQSPARRAPRPTTRWIPATLRGAT